MAVTSPAAAVAPEDTPKASASGSATAHTVSPAIMSCVSFFPLYPLNSFFRSLMYFLIMSLPSFRVPYNI